MIGPETTIVDVANDIWNTAIILTDDPYFIACVTVVVGLIVSLFMAEWLASIFIYKPKINEILVFEADQRRNKANEDAFIAIQNDEALKYEEKMGEKVGTSEDFAKLKY